MVVNITKRLLQSAWLGIFTILFISMVVLASQPAMAATYAAMVMDARDGSVLHAENADQRLHPASLTKMMTLYIAFEAVENGEISLDTKVKISKKAASEPPSKLGLKETFVGAFLKPRSINFATCLFLVAILLPPNTVVIILSLPLSADAVRV